MDNKFMVSSSPHIRDRISTQGIMFEVILALVPALIAGVIFFGIRTLFIVLFSMACAAFFEGIWQLLMKKPNTIPDGSALLTGMLLGFNMPVTVPLWVIIVGNAFAIIIVKQLFGGLGHNFMNPAMAGRAFLLAAWPALMTKWVLPFGGVDAYTSATVLSGNTQVTLQQAFLGNMAGCIGEVSALALLIGGIYLIIRKIIKPWIPLAFIATVFVITAIAGEDALLQICSGGLFLGAFFMATDYVTSPVTVRGQLIMGVGCGLITAIIRLWGGYPEGITYAILLMNAATPLIDKFTVPRKYGEVRNA